MSLIILHKIQDVVGEYPFFSYPVKAKTNPGKTKNDKPS